MLLSIQSTILSLFLSCCSVTLALGQQEQDAKQSQSDLLQIASFEKEKRAEYYEPSKVQSIYLQISVENQKRMRDALPNCIYVPATFHWRDISVKNVGVRYKGSSSANPHQKHKRSFLIKFSKFEEPQRFLGLERVSFDNGVQFGSLFSEPIITQILRESGVPSYRCNYAKVYLNEKFIGVYTNVERIDQVFINRHFPGSQGGLWKNDEGGPGGNLQFVGDDPNAYKKAFEDKNIFAKKNMPKLVGLIKTLNSVDKKDFKSFLNSNMDSDEFLRTVAILLLSGAFDQLTGWGPHNFYLHQDSNDNRWHYLPWDLDVGFCETAFGRVYVLDDWNAAWPIALSGRQNPLLNRIIEDPVLLSRYRTIAKEILGEHFEPTRLCKIIDDKYALIKKDLAADPFPAKRATVPDDKNYESIVASLKSFVRKRYQLASQQLNSPGQRPLKQQRRQQRNPAGVHAELQTKAQHVMQLAKKKQRSLQEIDKIMREIGPLIESGKTAEANKLLDRALELAK